jgi:hypothetical protein
VRFQLAPLAWTRNQRSQRTLYELIADIGSALETLEMILVFVLPIWALVFASSKALYSKEVRVKAAAVGSSNSPCDADGIISAAECEPMKSVEARPPTAA